MMNDLLHSARLDLELHGNILERALGRGGAPIDLNQARETIPLVAEALTKLGAILGRPAT